MLYVRNVHLKDQAFSSEMLHTDYDRKGSVEKIKLWSWCDAI
jgi:hypothetical protein